MDYPLQPASVISLVVVRSFPWGLEMFASSTGNHLARFIVESLEKLGFNDLAPRLPEQHGSDTTTTASTPHFRRRFRYESAREMKLLKPGTGSLL